MRATCFASVEAARLGGRIRCPGGSDSDMMQSMRIHRPCAASEHTDSAGSVSQSFQKNLPQGMPDMGQGRLVARGSKKRAQSPHP